MDFVNFSSVDSVFDYSGLIPRQFDLVIHHGGPDAVYLLGMYDVLKKLEKTGDIRISCYAGSDIAAILSVFLCSGVSKETIVSFCHMMFDDITDDRWKKEMLMTLPKNAYSMCDHRVYIYYSPYPTCYLWRFFTKPSVFYQFHSNREIVEACSISVNKPSRVVFKKNHKQLKIQLENVGPCCWNHFITPTKRRLYQFYKTTMMKKLIVKAEQDVNDFFFSQAVFSNQSGRCRVLKWYNCHDFILPNKPYKIVRCLFFTTIGLFLLFSSQKKIKSMTTVKPVAKII